MPDHKNYERHSPIVRDRNKKSRAQTRFEKWGATIDHNNLQGHNMCCLSELKSGVRLRSCGVMVLVR